MKKGTLILSRAVNLFPHYDNMLKSFGFRDLTFTEKKRDSLDFFIRDMNPEQVIVDAGFYHCATPFMMKGLLKKHPGLNLSAVALEEYPADLAMYFILNGLKSYAYMWDGMDEFKMGMMKIKNDKEYISPEVMKRKALWDDAEPPKTGNITDRQLEVLRLLCCGWKDVEIVSNLEISLDTMNIHRRNMFRSLNVRNSVELVRIAIYLEFVKVEETYFYPEGYEVVPKPKQKKIAQRTMKKGETGK